jgi:NADP-dependent 3-hydroxy acid dehydrogenase YdfG
MPTVILTGADGNVGTIVRQVLASRGWSVIGLDKDQADITDLSSVQDFIKTLDTPLSAVIHLVGGIDAGKSIEDADPSTLQRMLDLNVLTTYIMMHSCIPLLREAGGGCFVAMGAQSVQHPVPNRAAYSASKSAVVSLIQSLRKGVNTAFEPMPSFQASFTRRRISNGHQKRKQRSGQQEKT